MEEADARLQEVLASLLNEHGGNHEPALRQTFACLHNSGLYEAYSPQEEEQREEQVLAIFRSFPFRASSHSQQASSGTSNQVEETQAPTPREPEEAGEVVAAEGDPENVGEDTSHPAPEALPPIIPLEIHLGDCRTSGPELSRQEDLSAPPSSVPVSADSDQDLGQPEGSASSSRLAGEEQDIDEAFQQDGEEETKVDGLAAFGQQRDHVGGDSPETEEGQQGSHPSELYAGRLEHAGEESVEFERSENPDARRNRVANGYLAPDEEEQKEPDDPESTLREGASRVTADTISMSQTEDGYLESREEQDTHEPRRPPSYGSLVAMSNGVEEQVIMTGEREAEHQSKAGVTDNTTQAQQGSGREDQVAAGSDPRNGRFPQFRHERDSDAGGQLQIGAPPPLALAATAAIPPVTSAPMAAASASAATSGSGSQGTPTYAQVAEPHLKTGGQPLTHDNRAEAPRGMSADLQDTLKALKIRRRHRFVVMRIDGTEVVTSAIGSPKDGPAELREALPYSDCRYAVYDQEITTSDGRKANKLFFFSWLPHNATPHNKMAYSHGKVTVRQRLEGLYDVAASSFADIEVALGLIDEDEEDSDIDF